MSPLLKKRKYLIFLAGFGLILIARDAEANTKITTEANTSKTLELNTNQTIVVKASNTTEEDLNYTKDVDISITAETNDNTANNNVIVANTINTANNNVIEANTINTANNNVIEANTSNTVGVLTTIVKVEVALETSSASVKNDFLSFMVGLGKVRSNWDGMHFTSSKLINMAKALGPTNIRLGGTAADYLTFVKNGEINRKGLNFTMNGVQWLTFVNFAKQVNFRIMFNFNVMKRSKNRWDSTNAIDFLNFSQENNVKIGAFQLGNEPRSYKRKFGKKISPAKLVADMATLQETLNQFEMYKNSTIYGPELTNIRREPSLKYMKDFVASGGKDVVGGLSWHHYYGSPTTTIDAFYDKSVLDSFKGDIETMKSVAGAKPIRLTETSSCFGGGCQSISDRYVAGFKWLDKLGLSAEAGVTAVYRQAFIKAKYSLISRDLHPNPDYWLSLIFRRLVGGPVFNVTSDNSNLRVYANCVRRGPYKFPLGALVVYYLNIGDCPLTLDLPQFKNKVLKLWALSPDGGSITSNKVRLNGRVLAMSGDKLPRLKGITKQSIDVAAKTFGFIVILNANVTLCF